MVFGLFGQGSRAQIVFPALALLLLLLCWPSNYWPSLGLVAESNNTGTAQAESRGVAVPPPMAPHGPIYIDGDADFTSQAAAEGWPGSGTSSDPYIIEGYTIDRGGSAGHCININNTRLYFIIKDCVLTGASATYGCGIYLHNVSHATISSNTFSDSYYGIMLGWNCSDVVVRENTVSSGTFWGIRLERASHNTVINNTCNAINVGIALLVPTIYSGECRNNTVADNFCTGGMYGILLERADSNTIANNTCTSISYTGIHLEDSNYNSVFNNTCTDILVEGDGIAIISVYWNCDGNIVENNTCLNNFRYGIYLYTEYPEQHNCINSIVRYNIFDSNASGAHDVGVNNTFEYNYYWDYHGPDADQNGIGDVPYQIAGYLNNTDPYPLMRPQGWPPNWTQVPDIIYLLPNNPLRYDLNAAAPPPGIDKWWINDTTHFHIDGYGVLTNATPLQLGTYGVRVWVNDTTGSTITAAFKVVVTEEIPTTETTTQPPIPGFPLEAILPALAAAITLTLVRKHRKGKLHTQTSSDHQRLR